MSNVINFLIPFGLFLLTRGGACENILFYVGGVSTYSHHAGVEPLASKLADLGHNVTFFSPAKQESSNPKVKLYSPPELTRRFKQFEKDFGVQGLGARLQKPHYNDVFTGAAYYTACLEQLETIASSPDFKEWMKRVRFDLFIVDVPGNDWVHAWANLMGAKTIMYSSISGFYGHELDRHGIPPESSSIPAWDNNYEGEMGLWQRAQNVYSVISWTLHHELYYLPRVEEILRRELFPGGFPPLKSLLQDVGITLINHHPSDHFAKAVPPSVVRIGGLTLQESNGHLSENIEAFIAAKDRYDQGFIFVSFGSAITISSIPAETLQIFFDAFSRTNLKFLWKWEGAIPEGAPENIHFEPWFSQLDVLAHPKIRGFISQGGHISVQQAIFNGVPLIVFPINGDQDLNAKRIRVYENGIDLELSGLTSQILLEAIRKILEDPKYKEMSKLMQQLSKDRPMKPVDTAVWWTQFVLRNPRNITRLLKPLSIHQSWWETRNLDVWALVFFTLYTALLLILWATLQCLRSLAKSFFKAGAVATAANASKGKSAKSKFKRKGQ